MGQLFPTLYFSFDGFQRRQLKQDLLRAFNQSRLSDLGFKVQFSPRTVVDFGVPDGLTVTQQCQQASVFVALLEAQPGHGSRQNMLNTELSYALPEVGTQVVLISEAEQPDLPAQLARQLEQQSIAISPLASDDLPQRVFRHLEQHLLGEQSPQQLTILTSDYSIDGATLDINEQALQQRRDGNLLAQLYGQAPEPANGSPALADLQQHRHWGMANLQLDNPKGAMANIEQCLALNDSDLMANYWRCRLLAQDAEKESDCHELIRRAQLILKHLQHQQETQPELTAQCYYFQSLGYAGLKRYDESLSAITESLPFQHSTAWQHQTALRALQLLSQQDALPERLDPALLAAKTCFLTMLSDSLEGFQLAFRQLLLKTPKEKLEVVVLGVKQVVIGSLKQIKQHEQALIDHCADCDLLVPTQLDQEQVNDAMGKSIWNLLAIGHDSVIQQVTLLQLLAKQLNDDQAKAEALEADAEEQAQQQQRLTQDLAKQQHKYQDICSAKKLSLIGSVVAGALSALLISGFWWLPLTPLVISILLAGAGAALVLLLVLLSRQNTMVGHIQQRCRELDSFYALDDDELPEPRAMEGWFDRLIIRRDKRAERQQQLLTKAGQVREQLAPRLQQFVAMQYTFGEAVLKQLDGAFVSVRFNGKAPSYQRVSGMEQQQLPTALAEQLPEQQCPNYYLQRHPQHGEQADLSDIYFADPIDSTRLRQLNVVQTAANTEVITTLVRAPVMTSEEPLALHKWLVQTGEQVAPEQAIAELQNADISIPLVAPTAGVVTKQLVDEGHDLSPDQAVLELQTD
ncbi:lipoyl domain-containing protein [Neiella marina]|uniref:Lipoyl domain-containing protein n=1 Tax=Neiella holothuriorum TaxID=2870530 RepID=A0ABS7EIA2_9GAMM|nr:lipoyl domain-containing protein [Neiella holothuriorum]MBW8192088.1 lipoyl domain-containing protein [Neiella holothuriorum]